MVTASSFYQVILISQMPLTRSCVIMVSNEEEEEEVGAVTNPVTDTQCSINTLSLKACVGATHQLN